MLKMKIESFCVGEVGTNCYFAINSETNEMLVVDPGAAAKQLANNITKLGCKPTGILLTHGHFDHAGAAEELAQLLGVKIYAQVVEKDTLENPRINLSGMIGKQESYHADVYLKDGEVFELAGFSIKAIHTPGHTKGGCCYYVEQENVLFSGDTLFCQSVGRTDFPEGSMSQLSKSIKEKLFLLPDHTQVYPGHMDLTSIGHEKKYNPFL